MIRNDVAHNYPRERRQSRSSGVDRVELLLSRPLNISDLIQRFNEQGHSIEIWHDGYNCYLHSKTWNPYILAKLRHKYAQNSHILVFNPNRFQNSFELDKKLEFFCDSKYYSRSKIIRIDLQVDLNVELKSVVYGLDVSFKRKVNQYISGVLTGINFGAGEEKVVVYDWGLKHLKKPNKVTRIEVRFRGRKLPVRYYYELCNLPSLIEEEAFKPFKNISLTSVQIKDNLKINSVNSAFRFGKLVTSLDLQGYSLTKKYLNQNKNYHRDYHHYLDINDEVVPLDLFLYESLIDYFGE